MSSMISVSGLTFFYKTSEPVLQELDFDVKQGEMVAIVGPSGSGKSTLLHMLGCLLKAKKGQIVVDGVDISKLSSKQLAYFRAQKLGFVFQEFHLLPRLTVLENILMPAMYPVEASHITKNDKLRALEIAKDLGIEHRLHYFPNELSGGEQQRVAIARALIKNPDILFADEPTGNLDSKSTENILQILEKLNLEGQTIVLITHDEKVAQHASRIVHFQDGKILSSEKGQHRSIETEKTIEKQKFRTAGSSILAFARLLPLAFQNIVRHKLRSMLTMLGIVIGIAAIVGMVTLGQFTKRKILATYTVLGANTMSISGYRNYRLQATDVVPAFYQSFDMENDIGPLKTVFPQINAVSPFLKSWNVDVSYSGKSTGERVMLYGVDRDYLQISDRSLQYGKNFNWYNMENSSSVCIVGSEVASALFGRTASALDKVVHILQRDKTLTCQIIGVLKHQSRAGSSGDPNLLVIVPYTYYQMLSTSSWESAINQILVKVAPQTDMKRIGLAMTHYFENKYGKSGNFRVDTNTLLLAQMKKFLNLFTLMLASIALVALIVGGIGIMNMMLVSVSERYREIGIRKAVGATDSSVRLQFLLEAVLLCFSAGIIGIVFGIVFYESAIYLASKFVAKLQFEWVFSSTAISLAFISMLLVGLLSGLFPALKAERLQIVYALRSQ